MEACLLGEGSGANAPAEKASFLCITWGASGAAILRRSDMTLCITPAFLLPNPDQSSPHAHTQVVDTIGAGDTFAAGMLYGLYFSQQSWTLQRTLEFANELAGRRVCQQGSEGLGDSMVDRVGGKGAGPAQA